MINTLIIDKQAPGFIAVVGALAVFLVSYLLGFIAASFSELRLWIALRKAIPAPTLDEASSGGESREPRGRKWHIMLAMVALVVLCIIEFNLIIKSPSTQPIQEIQEITLGIIYGIIYGGLFYATSRFANRILGLNRVVVHRTPDGGYLKHLHAERRSNKEHIGIMLLIILATLLVLLGLLATGNIISVSIVTMAIVHLVSSSSFGKLTLLKMIKRYILISVTIVALIILQRLIYLKQVNNNALQTSSPWLNVLFVPTALCSVFSGGLIARMLRFDYQRHLNGPDGSQEIILATAPAPTEVVNSIFYKKEDLVEGILIPQWAPRAFLKPYFTVALVTWSILQITIIALYLGIGSPISNPYAMCAMALLLEFPVIVIVLSLFAAVRKEAKALWNYDEGWKLSLTEGEISL